MKLPANLYRPIAIGTPLPLRELPVRPERMIHFFPPHVEKIRARIPEMAKQIAGRKPTWKAVLSACARIAQRARLDHCSARQPYKRTQHRLVTGRDIETCFLPLHPSIESDLPGYGKPINGSEH